MEAVFVWIAVAGLAVFTYRKYAATAADWPQVRQRSRFEHFMYVVIGVWLRRTGAYYFIVSRFPQLAQYCLVLYGTNQHPDPAFVWTIKTVSLSIAGVLTVLLASAANIDPAIVGIMTGSIVALPVLRWREIVTSVKRRREAFISELPTFIHKMSLMLTAGETIQSAWVRASTARLEQWDHPLYAELTKTSMELSQAVPFPKALEDLHRRSGVHEMSALVTTVLMNYKRGGEAFATALQDTSRLMMERKYTIVRTKGEEASTKLIAPMMLMLMAVMLIVAAPALMMMK
jgi:tight adherence protein C